jgi:hypothetical protein
MKIQNDDAKEKLKIGKSFFMMKLKAICMD